METTTEALERQSTSPGRSQVLVFVSLVLAVWSSMHLYVGARLVWLADAIWPAAVLLIAWLAFPCTKIAERVFRRAAPGWLEQTASTWLGVLFLLLVCLGVADVTSMLLDLSSGVAHMGALGCALTLSLLGVIQGSRAPRIVEHRLRLQSLPANLHGTLIVQLTDLHLGGVLGEGWLRSIAHQVKAVQPDLIALTGDIVDTDAALSARRNPQRTVAVARR